MKTFYYYLLTALVALGGIQTIQAQDKDKDKGYGGHWFLGLSGGAAWQTSDACTQLGGGWSLYLGKNIYYSPTSPLSLDLRLRYLGTQTFTQDFETMNISNNPLYNGQITGVFGQPDYSGNGFIYMNSRTGFHDLSLEARLNFENLRRKYRIWLSVYGGVGVGWYRTATDQVDQRITFDDNYANMYSNIAGDSSLTDRREIVNQLISGRDGIYDTWTGGFSDGKYRATFTPDVGFELGYWITPRFAMGVGHRVNWTFRDDFDGVLRGKANDIHHYANLFMHFRLTGGGSTRVKPTPNPQPQPIVAAPQVNITTPGSNPATVNQNPTRIRATIRNVESANGVQLQVNGTNTSIFSFNPATDILEASISLNPGNNTVRVVGTNSTGTAQDQVTIIYQQPQVQSNPPTVNITNPANNPHTTQNSSQTINATITNVSSPSNVTFSVNGEVRNNFTLSGTSFTATNVALIQGGNNVVITATNPDGTASDNVVINYQPTQANPPTVNITTPGSNPFNTNTPSQTIRATITNVATANNVTFTVNGQTIRNFTFSGTNFTATNIALNQGLNTIRVSGTNNDGNAFDEVAINYQPVRVPTPPTVQITEPNANPHNTQNQTQTIRAAITNVPSRTGVTFSINGQTSSSFSFSGTSFVATNVTLQQGANTIRITGVNNDGTASDDVIINYQPAHIPNPPTVNITNPAANPHNTQTATQTVTATITNAPTRGNVSCTVNGQTYTNFTYTGTVFTAVNVPLQQGANAVVISANNEDGAASDNVTINYQPARVPTPPTVNITNPSANPYNTQSPTQTINATITNVASANNVTFTVNGQTIRNFTLSGTAFTANNVNLQQGNNAVVISASNQDGNASDNTVITYTVRVNPPVVTITQPNANPYTTTGQTETIRATILNVANASGVTFTVNGQNVTNFNFSGTSFTATNVAMNAGNNTITITGTNSAGSDTKSTVIVRNVRPAPTVTITNPSANPHNASTPTQTVVATITNVANANNVTFTINNVPSRDFTLNGITFTAPNIRLNEGNNTVVITATNPQGTGSDQTVINYTKPINPPVVTITQPNTNPYTTPTQTTTIRATILNVASSNEVAFLVNGQSVTNFSFSGTNFVATNVPMRQGANNISITGRNRAGQDTKTTVINYNPAPAPSIEDMTVGVQNAAVGCVVMINAGLTNVTNINQVRFNINGVATTGFTLNNGIFSYRYNVTSDNPSTINYSIVVTTEGGTATETKTGNVGNCGPRVSPPDVMNSNVTIGPERNFCIATVTARTVHIDNASQITFTVNGQRNTNFTFSNGVFNARVDVTGVSASNISFVITGTNSAGTDAESITGSLSNCSSINNGGNVNIGGDPVNPNTSNQIPKPSVTFTSPRLGTTTTDKTLVTATLVGVSQKSQVVFKVNGVVKTNFTLNGGGTAFRAENVQLNAGTNVLEIKATNRGGSDTQTFNITYTAGGGGSNTGDKPIDKGDDQKGRGGDQNKIDQKGRGGL